MEELQLVVFRLGKEEYGVDIAKVQEIVRVQEVTHIPQAPAFVEGIVNLRGNIIPIVDLKKRFNLEGGDVSEKEKRVIVVNVGKQIVGIVVDSVSEIIRIPRENVEPPPPIVAGIEATYIEGVGKIDKRLIILLNIEKILTEKEKEELKTLDYSS
ncbi:MAG: chemotaxis protein CheW [Synergistetes bacterium]|nr:MAG: CheW protein [bacterium 42_11]MBC7332557.1 chemotaxis protein CheW [Synergistota bacterium]MDK2871065.1 purine-binding chemotaxis protein CheW [bacterium]